MVVESTWHHETYAHNLSAFGVVGVGHNLNKTSVIAGRPAAVTRASTPLPLPLQITLLHGGHGGLNPGIKKF